MPKPEPGQKLDFDQIDQYVKQNNFKNQRIPNNLTSGQIAMIVAKSSNHKAGTKPYRKIYTHVLHKLYWEKIQELIRSNDENCKQREKERLIKNQKYSLQYRKEISKRKRLGIMTEKDKLFYEYGVERKRKSRKRRKVNKKG